MFWTKEIAATVAFYTDVLGFECGLLEEGWAVLLRDEIEVMLAYPNEHVTFNGPMFTGSFYINTTNVDELWEAYKDTCNKIVMNNSDEPEEIIAITEEISVDLRNSILVDI
jgi:hypothetical protein